MAMACARVHAVLPTASMCKCTVSSLRQLRQLSAYCMHAVLGICPVSLQYAAYMACPDDQHRQHPISYAERHRNQQQEATESLQKAEPGLVRRHSQGPALHALHA